MRQTIAIFLVLLASVICGCADDSTDSATDCRAGDECDDTIREADMGETCDDETCTQCAIGPDGGFCATEFCKLTVEPGSVEQLTRFTLAEGVPPGVVQADVVGARTCRLGEPFYPLVGPVELAVKYADSDVPASYAPNEFVAVDVATFRQVQGVHNIPAREMSFAVQQSFELAISAVPSTFDFRQQLGVRAVNIDDPAELQLELSKYTFNDVFFDGQRLYVANGPRVLIWNQMPIGPNIPPDVVLGRPQLGLEIKAVSASNFGGAANGVWSDGNRLAVAEGNRVLIWNQIPQANYAPADLVLGQPNFSSIEANGGGTAAADTLQYAMDVESDGERFIVSDFRNNRVLVWNSFPAVSGQPADLVIGQESLEETTAAIGATSLYQPIGALIHKGRLALTSALSCRCIYVFDGIPTISNPAPSYLVGETGAGLRVTPESFSLAGSLSRFGEDGIALRNWTRLSIWRDFPASSQPADITLGKPDTALGGVLGRITASSFAYTYPYTKAYSDQTMLVVADGHRLLFYDGLPNFSYEPAAWVMGQPSSATSQADVDYRGIGPETLARPAAMAAYGETVGIADRANNRVVLRTRQMDGSLSTVIIGQPDGAASGPNLDWNSPSAATLNTPSGLAFSADGKMAVADSSNHRVLVWNSIPTIDATPADHVFGQPDMQSTAPNRGALDANQDGLRDASDQSLHYPTNVTWEGDAIWVADTYNHRVLRFEVGQNAANRVLGQADFTGQLPNRTGDWWSPTVNSLARPTDVAWVDGTLWVVDSQNSRILGFGAAPDAQQVIGQPDFNQNISPAYLDGFNSGVPVNETSKVASANSLRLPTSLSGSSEGLWVADSGNHRVVFFPSGSLDATQVWGQPNLSQRSPNVSGLNRSGLSTPEGVLATAEGLLISDTDNHRVLHYSDTFDADEIWGQSGFSRNGINGAAPAKDSLDTPSGIGITKETLWVADRKHHRVVAMRESEFVQVIGQADLGGQQPNRGAERPSGNSMYDPSDVWTDGLRLIIADRNNHRVLIWNEYPDDPDQPADVVLGQPDATSGAPNAGAGAGNPSALGMLAPEGVFSFNNAVYVADSGNSRILVWSQWPTANQPTPDQVLCQTDFESNAPNQGLAAPSASSCANPSDLLITQDHVWVADTLNNRVLRFPKDGQSADLVLGQPDFQTRSPVNASLLVDGRTFGAPTGLDTDDVNLFIVDSGNHRVLVYPLEINESGKEALYPIGQPSLLSGTPSSSLYGLNAPRSIAVFKEPLRATTVFVTDSGSDRIAVWERIPRPIPFAE